MNDESNVEQAGKVVLDAMFHAARQQGHILSEEKQRAAWENVLVREQCVFAAGELARWILSQHSFGQVESKADDVAMLPTEKMVSIAGGKSEQ